MGLMPYYEPSALNTAAPAAYPRGVRERWKQDC